MRLGNRSLHFIINFLLGVAWAVALIGAATSFFSFYESSFMLAVVSALIGAIPGILGVLLAEYFITEQEKLEELKKQTALLEKIVEGLRAED